MELKSRNDSLLPVHWKSFFRGAYPRFLAAILAQIYIMRASGSLPLSAALRELPFPCRSRRQGSPVVLLLRPGALRHGTPISWVDPPRAVQLLLFYLRRLGRRVLSSALDLVPVPGCRGSRAQAARIRRDLTGKPRDTVVARAGRASCRQGPGAAGLAPFVLSGYGAAYAGSYELRSLRALRPHPAGVHSRHPCRAFHDPGRFCGVTRAGSSPCSLIFSSSREITSRTRLPISLECVEEWPVSEPATLRGRLRISCTSTDPGRSSGSFFPGSTASRFCVIHTGHPYPGGAFRRCRQWMNLDAGEPDLDAALRGLTLISRRSCFRTKSLARSFP